MNFRITDDVSEHDVNEIHRMLKDYNLVIAKNQKFPIGLFFEDENNRKLAGWIDRRDIRKLALHSIPFCQ